MRAMRSFSWLMLFSLAACGVDETGTAPSTSSDADGDLITNGDEGSATSVNTDGDEHPD